MVTEFKVRYTFSRSNTALDGLELTNQLQACIKLYNNKSNVF